MEPEKEVENETQREPVNETERGARYGRGYTERGRAEQGREIG